MSDEYLPGNFQKEWILEVCAKLFLGAMVLGHSLKDHGTKKQLAALVTLDSLKASTVDELRVRIATNCNCMDPKNSV